MHSSGSILKTIIERLRNYHDLSTTKWDDDYLIRNVVMPEYVNVLGRLALDYDNPVHLRYSLDVNTTTEYYVLPPMVGEIRRISIFIRDTRRISQELVPKDFNHPSGEGWSIEGNMLAFRPLPSRDETWDVWYIPTGDFLMHYATDGVLSASEDEVSGYDTFTLSADPALGDVDKRVNAYAGAMLRILDGGGGVVEERVIESYDAATRTCTLRLPLTSQEFQGSSTSTTEPDLPPITEMTYEVVPVGMSQAMTSAVAASGAMNVGLLMDASGVKMTLLGREYKRHLKTIADRLNHMNMRKPDHYDRNTRDNPWRGIWYH
jgi:hypothetical protein